ncbi:MAG TPA: rhodanese-like domain-containing protein [Candidatus Limnocylindrales bacterium]|nr:rhodanese-like domain-containing protein [Candidatus Limnocylindrales bacterium]
MDPRRIPAIDVLEAERRLRTPGDAGEPLLVDVREPNEFSQFRAEGAVLFPLSTWMLRYRDLPQDRPLLMICRTGARSGQATAFLLANGWTDVVNVAGGTMAWERAGLPLRQGPPADGEGDLPG